MPKDASWMSLCRDVVSDALASSNALEAASRLQAGASKIARDSAALNQTMADWVDAEEVPLEAGGGLLHDRSLWAGRYRDLGRLGEGGMSVVRRVRDERLQRVVAMKILRAKTPHSQRTQRFLAEAQATAQLQHPGIVPIYDVGVLDDGRPFFTMPVISGVSLDVLVREAHASPGGVPLKRLIDAFRRVCDAVAYAHARGVVHRDLKPQNVMVGRFNGVLVVDWGLAKVESEPAAVSGWHEGDPLGEAVEGSGAGAPVVRAPGDLWRTRVGSVVGTPAYMAPEQARGERDVGRAADVYALGATLWEMVIGEAPHLGVDVKSMLAARRDASESEVPEAVKAWPVPRGLASVMRRALQPDPGARYPDAAALGAAVNAWLQGAERREKARATVAEASLLSRRSEASAARARALEVSATKAWSELSPRDPVSAKRKAWALEDEARAAKRESQLLAERQVRVLHAALRQEPTLPEAHDALALHYRRLHERAEAAQDELAAATLEETLRVHDRGVHDRYLRGVGSLSLVTDPPGVEVVLCRYELQDRRRVPVAERSLGLTPLHQVEVPSGDSLLRLRHAGGPEVVYPLHVAREAHWDGCAPGSDAPVVLRMPKPGELRQNDVLVPAGWAWLGGDVEAVNGVSRRRVWVDAFVMHRQPVTNRDYLAFLNDLVAQGREAEALRWAPRERGATPGEAGGLLLGRDAQQRFVLTPDADGDIWSLDWPVLMIDWYGAAAYARWHAETTGEAWRLPSEFEREKAARGADGRPFPWGLALDATYACTRDSHDGRWMPAEVQAFPTDESVYGVRGLAGNSNDWCLEPWRAEPPADGAVLHVAQPDADRDATPEPRVHRGGRWNGTAAGARAATRLSSDPRVRTWFLGARLARSW